MKKRLFTLCFALTAMCVSTMAQVEINETNFPDENFRTFVSQNTIDTNGDGVLSQAEINAVEDLDVSNKGIKDLTGIEYFTNLSVLTCSGNDIKGANMYKLVSLLPTKTGTFRVCDASVSTDNVITKAQVTTAKNKGWTVEKYKRVGSYKYVSYDGEDLTVSAKFFPDATFRSVVVDYDTDHNSILSEDELEKVLTIDVKNKGIKDLQGVEHFQNLVGLLCSGNNLTTLDVSNNKKLMILDCSNNSNMTSLTVSKDCEVLNEVAVYGTNIKGAEMTKVVENLPETTVGHFFLSSGFNNLITIDARVEADRKGWKVLFYDGENFKYAGYGITERNFPDENFRAFVAQYDTDNDNFLYSTELDLVTAMDVSEQGIKDLTGIECFSSMFSLNCQKNQLTALDLTMNQKLTFLCCWGNNISGAAMTDLVNNLPDVTTLNEYCEFIVGDDSSNPDNSITTAQVKVAADKGWVVEKFINGSLQENYAGFDPVPINEDNFPDPNFRKFVAAKAINANEDGFLSEEELKAVKIMNVSSKEISSLKGIEFFTALTKLNCSINSLTSLDVSKNTALTVLFCSYNSLKSLDVSKKTALKELDCSNNSLTSLDVSKNTALEWLGCDNNSLTSLDVSKNTALWSLSCSRNSLESLDLSQNTELTYIACGYNSLGTLDLSHNTKLWTLYCNNCGLSSLDISGNTQINRLICDDNNLTTLDVSKNTWLQSINCGGNLLTSLDFTNNTNLNGLTCEGDQIRGDNMTNLVNSLPEAFNGKMYVCSDRVNPDNVITAAQVKVANDKGWKVIKFLGNGMSEYAGLGDVNGDNKIDHDDLDLIVKIIMGKKPGDVGDYAGDLNMDGKTDARDVVIMVNILKSLGK